MRNPIDRLLDEHRDIMADVEGLRRAVAQLRERRDGALPAALPVLRRVGHMMATRLLAHARREDDALFPALERIFGSTDTPTAVMRQEHAAIHDHARLFRETLRELNEVEHPVIVASGATLRRLTESDADVAQLAETGEEIVELLDLHFRKEEEVLFPMARAMLSDDDLADVERAMEALEESVAP